MQRLVIIDGHAILHRAYHALPPLTTKSGVPIGAVYGFLSMLIRTIAELKPEYLLVAFDRPEPTFRKELYANYQIQRPKTDEALIGQIELMKSLLLRMGITIYEKSGFEADDVIGTLARQASTEPGQDVVIITGDKDILQLVDKNTKVYMPVKGLSEAKLYGVEEVEEKFGVKPSQIADFKALIGDSSDNYPGVAGIGPKTAAELLRKFGTLEGIYRNVSGIEQNKIREKLEAGIEEAKMCKKLSEIVTSVPVTLDREKTVLRKLDRPDIHEIFEEMEFRSLIQRLSYSEQASGDKKASAGRAEQTKLF